MTTKLWALTVAIKEKILLRIGDRYCAKVVNQVN
jgi:hypothetical protein